MANIFDTFLVHPIINLLVIIYQGLNFVNFPFALGFSIILLTVLIRLALYPLMGSQLKTSKKMQDIAPHVHKLKEKHKGDAKRIQAETMRLYKEHGVNPAAGCLPVLIQLPMIWALYSVLIKIVNLKPEAVVSEINKIIYFDVFKLQNPWDPNFFGLSLGQNPSQIISSLGPVILLVPFITGALQFIQSKMMAAKKAPNQEIKKDDFASSFQTQTLYIFPVMIGFFSFTFPIGLSLYWNTFTFFGILQQYQISGWGGLAEWKEKLLKKRS